MSDISQVYQPAEDTYLLLEAARQEVRPADRVLEVGTGTGIIAASLAGAAGCVVASDINPCAALSAYEQGIEVVRTDLVSGVRGLFDLILFNPPYLPTLPEERIDDWLEYALDGGRTGRQVIKRFADDIGRVLATGGRVLLLISSLTGLADVEEIFRSRNFVPEIFIDQKIEGETLYVLRITRS